MKAKIKFKKEIAKDTLFVEFDLSPNIIKFFAGQYFYIELNNPPFEDEKGNTRHFSITSSPNQKTIIQMATRIRDSAFKKSLLDLSLGEKVEIGPIEGDFILPKNTKKPLVFFAGGIGITPFRSMLLYVLENSLNYKITLIYSNKNIESTAFYYELQNLAKKNPNINIVFIMTQDPNWKGEKRRIDENLIKEYFPNQNSNTYYIAGPPSMVEEIYLSLKKANIDSKNIKKENFSGY